MKEEFAYYLKKNNKQGSQKASSYIRAIELLDIILNSKAKSKLHGFESVYNIISANKIEDLYQYILIEQNNEKGIFENEEPSSYWKYKFYSAALKSYLDFLNQNDTDKKFPKNMEENNILDYNGEIKIECSSIRDFALMVFKYFYEDDWDFLLNESKIKDALINEKNYKIFDHEWFKNLIGCFDHPQDKNSLSSSNTIRYFEVPIYIKDGEYYYFSTQWNANGEYNLSFKNLKKFIEDRFPNYSVVHDDKTFRLISIQNKQSKIPQNPFNISTFKTDCERSGLQCSNQLITRYISSLATKPFVLLSGLSGSGKTKLAQAFAQWICENQEQYCIVPVGADWNNREPLLGYVNALNPKEYILPENKALELIIKANSDETKPHFLILDEMNLSHVERYFADFLSIMESNDNFKLHSSKEKLNNIKDKEFENSLEVPSELPWPKNLFVVGTVNIDETTYMFSPKVLDRANVIEFRISTDDLANYFKPDNNPFDMKKLWLDNTKVGKGAQYAEDFVAIAIVETDKKNLETLNSELHKFFQQLQTVGAEFGYRSASEIQTLFTKIDLVNPEYAAKTNDKIDIAIMQKLLPKLHGSRSKLIDVLKLLGNLCVASNNLSKDKQDNIFKTIKDDNLSIIYPISLEKIERMYDNVIANGFTSYAEA